MDADKQALWGSSMSSYVCSKKTLEINPENSIMQVGHCLPQQGGFPSKGSENFPKRIREKKKKKKKTLDKSGRCGTPACPPTCPPRRPWRSIPSTPSCRHATAPIGKDRPDEGLLLTLAYPATAWTPSSIRAVHGRSNTLLWCSALALVNFTYMLQSVVDMTAAIAARCREQKIDGTVSLPSDNSLPFTSLSSPFRGAVSGF